MAQLLEALECLMVERQLFIPRFARSLDGRPVPTVSEKCQKPERIRVP